MAELQPVPPAEDIDDIREIYILSIGEVIEYRSLHFPVLSAMIRRIRFSVQDQGPEEDIDSVNKVYDGFIRECSSVHRQYPMHLLVKSNSLDFFSVPTSEFSTDMTNMELYEGGVLVIWNWKWGDEIDDTTCTMSAPEEFTCASAESGSGQVSDSEDEDLTHTVVFKCIGSKKKLITKKFYKLCL